MNMQTTSNRISIIIVTCGVRDYCIHCLEAISQQTYGEFEVIVIDNTLRPEFSQEILSRYPDIQLYSSLDNLSYCDALNKGIELSRGDYIFCLNDDVILDKRFIEQAFKGFSVDRRVGMVSGKILRSDGKTVDSTGLFLTFWRTAKERGYGRKYLGQFEKPGYVFGVNGAAAFYRKKMLDEIKEKNYFDSDFRFFYEDLDIAWRARHSGWRGYYIPSAVCYHLRGGTVRMKNGIDKPFARRYLNDNLHADLIKNRYLTIIKNEPCLSFLVHLPAVLLYDCIIMGYLLLFKRRLLKSLFLNLKYLISAIKKRLLNSLPCWKNVITRRKNCIKIT